MKKIDAHNHPGLSGWTYEEIIAQQDEAGIDKIFLLAIEATNTDEPGPLDIALERCLEYYERSPERFLLGCAPDPRIPGAIDRLELLVRDYGIKICGEVKIRMMYDNRDAIDMFRRCGELRLPVVLHMQEAAASPTHQKYPRPHMWYGGDIDTVERVLALCPETAIMAHSTAFWSFISNDDKGKTQNYPRGEVIPGGKIEKLLEKYPNLYCDCSGDSGLFALQRSPEYAKKLMLTYPEKFIFARDFYSNELSDFVDSLGLPEENLELFYHGNLERLIGEEL
ncbi:MAG: amidohydrolase family protein [Clostridia bacterium]|nr:amidohydrolase family protein [Clostridia bacterium]